MTEFYAIPRSQRYPKHDGFARLLDAVSCNSETRKHLGSSLAIVLCAFAISFILLRTMVWLGDT